MSYNDILITCEFCRKRKKFCEMDQVCLCPLTEEEVEKFRKEGKKPLQLEFAMRCNRCKEKEILTTWDGYSIDTSPVEVISKEKTLEIALDKEIGRYRASEFKKFRRK